MLKINMKWEIQARIIIIMIFLLESNKLPCYPDRPISFIASPMIRYTRKMQHTQTQTKYHHS
jgi:hypothetical protein